MRKLVFITTAVLALTACQQSDAPAKDNPAQTEAALEAAQAVNAQLDVWFETKFMENARRYPQVLAGLGIKERTSEWNDPSRAFALEQLERTKSDLAELTSTFDRSALTADRQLSYDLYVRQAENSIEDDEWWGYNYPFNQMFGAQSGIPTFLLNQHRIDNEADAKAYIARINAVQSYLGEIVKNAKESADRGIMPPRFVYDHVLRDVGNVMTGAPFTKIGKDNLILKDFKAKLGNLDLDEDASKALIAEANDALFTSFRPAFQALNTELKRQQALSTEDDGAWKLPKGEDFYAWRLNRMTTTDMSAAEIHQLGLDEVARIHGEMRTIMKEVGFEGTLQEFFTYLKTDPKFTYEDSDAGRQAYLDEATRMIDVMKTRLDDVFLKKPVADLEVRRVEDFREKSAGKAFYNRPAADGSRPGYYYANLYKITDMPKYQMEALAYHEGIPGHHMQLAIAQELTGVPQFQKYARVTAYTEGWGLYSEFLPKEMGFYEDPYSDFGRLSMEIWRAARLVVDTGLHDKKWTRQEAIDYLLDNTPNPENDAIKAIERYIVMPGQATAYKIGMIKIQNLREDAKARLGDKFDIREFHDVVLKSGPLPLSILETQVDDWVKSKG
ncbi:MAG: DUF885 domain-containing protein [Alphaproteobacteria bacterium]